MNLPHTAEKDRSRRLLLVIDSPSRLLHRSHHARLAARHPDRSGRPAWALRWMVRQVP